MAQGRESPHFLVGLVTFLMPAISVSWAPAGEPTPTPAATPISLPVAGPTPPPGADAGGTPAPEPTPFAYAAPAFIKDLDAKYLFPPSVLPSRPRYGGVLHFPIPVIRAFDPTVGYRTELALVWDTLTKWEATWCFPEVQTTPMIRQTLAESWQMIDPSGWDFRLRQGVKFHNLPPVNRRAMTAEDVRYSYDLLQDKSGYSNWAAFVKEVEVLDKYSVRLHLKFPDPSVFLWGALLLVPGLLLV
jgi:ABC-type transport system substrate-binding protein